MYRGVESPPLLTTDLEICQVGPEQAQAFGDTAMKGFEFPASLHALATLIAVGVGRPGWRHYLAYDGQTPAATSGLYVKNGVGWCGYGSTLPAYRRRGVQSAMFARRIVDASVGRNSEMACNRLVTETDTETPTARATPTVIWCVPVSNWLMRGPTTFGAIDGLTAEDSKKEENMRRNIALTLALVLAYLLAGLPSRALAQQADCRTFTETGNTVCGKFLAYWDGHGGLTQQGFPISGELQEVSPTDGKTYTVQYFERAIFELHPENAAPNDVLLSLLGVFLYQSKYPSGAPGQQPNNAAGSLLFNETGKRMGGRFLDYWQNHGGLAQQGLAISDEFMETSSLDGKTYLVQYFERAVFEYHPEQQPEFQVLLSQLGTFRYREKYSSAQPPATPASGVPTPTQPAAQPTNTPAVQPTSTPATQPPPGGAPPLTCSAPPGQYCAAAELSDPTPPPSSSEIVTARLLKGGQPVQGATMSTTWHYKTTSSSCDGGATDAAGYASCTKPIGRPSRGYMVKIDVTFTVNGVVVARTQTEFTPQ